MPQFFARRGLRLWLTGASHQRHYECPDTENAGAIASYALAHLGEPYSAAAVARSKLIPKTTPDRRRLYCSTLVGLVVAEATDIQLASEWRHRPLQPATLATHSDRSIVDIAWRTVADAADISRHARAYEAANALTPHVVPGAAGGLR